MRMKIIIDRISRAWYSDRLGMFIIRFVAGLIFFLHGWDKWHSFPGTVSMFELLGFYGSVAYAITVLEVVGGIALMLGVATRLFGLLFGIEMITAAIVVNAHMPRGFHGYEFELLLAAVSFGIMFVGSGAFSLYALECERCGGVFCDGEACIAELN